MLSQELLKKVKRIEITTRRVMNDVMAGNYRSHFKGQGMQFSEHRTYVAGDDVRHIDWKVSARTREVLVKKFEEERELNVFFVIDISASSLYGTEEKTKEETVAEAAAVLAHAAHLTGDKVGALLFAGEVELIIPPKKGRAHILRIVREILAHEPKSQGTNLALALRTATRIMKHSGVVFVLSDFVAQDYASELRRLAKKHDVVAVNVRDRRDDEIPALGAITFLDPESGVESVVDTSSYRFQEWFRKFTRAREEELQQLFRSSRVEQIRLMTREDYIDAIVRFFRLRHKQRA